MSRLALLAKPHWKELLALPGVGDLPTSALVAADSFFDFVRSHGLALPRSADVALWCQGQTGVDPVARLGSLRQAMEVCAPSFVATVAGAQGLLEKTSSTPLAQARGDQMTGSGAGGAAMRPAAGAPWDPIAPPVRRPPRPRKVSVAPCALPVDWQEALRRAAHGLPSNGVAIGSRAIVIRMREKMCQLAWSAVRANLPVELSEETVNCYHTDLTERLVEKKE